jgi:hypothetical protein
MRKYEVIEGRKWYITPEGVRFNKSMHELSCRARPRWIWQAFVVKNETPQEAPVIQFAREYGLGGSWEYFFSKAEALSAARALLVA